MHIALALLAALARLVNYTIDDTRAAVHLRAPLERAISARPDGTQAFDETWHDETTFPGQLPSNVSFTFNGTVLYIFCILANNINIVHNDTRLAFYLDGSPTPIDQFLHEPDLKVDGFIYGQLVFKSDAALAHGEHTMLVSNWPDGERLACAV